jgi:hypothetical protein
MPQRRTSSSTSTKPRATSTEPSKPKPDLSAYLQITREGNPDAPNVEGQFWIGSLALTNASVSLYAKSEAELQARAKELLAAHGVEV